MRNLIQHPEIRLELLKTAVLSILENCLRVSIIAANLKDYTKWE